MDERTQKVIDYLEKNYHNDISEEKIEGITGIWIENFLAEFKKHTEMEFSVYKIRRQLTLIKQEINESSISFKEADVSPFENHFIYAAYFQREFKVPIEAAMKDDNLIFQSEYGSENWRKNETVINYLLSHFRPNDALRHLLSQPPIYLHADTNFLELISENGSTLGLKMKNSYLPPLRSGIIERLPTIYISRKDYIIKDAKGRDVRYALVNRGLIYKLILEFEAEVEYLPSDLKTLWSIFPGSDIPLGKDLDPISESIIRALVDQDFGENTFELLEELRSWISVDYSKPKNVEGQVGHSIHYFYEVLNLEDMEKRLHELLIQGLIYLGK